MGFGGLASAAIMFIAVVVVTGAITAMMTRQVDDVTTSAINSQDYAANKMKTDIVIDHVHYNTTNTIVYVYVKNTGLTSLDLNDMTVYINNDFYRVNGSSAPAAVLPDTNAVGAYTFDQNEVLLVNITTAIGASQTNTVKVVTPYNTESSKIFTT